MSAFNGQRVSSKQTIGSLRKVFRPYPGLIDSFQELFAGGTGGSSSSSKRSGKGGRGAGAQRSTKRRRTQHVAYNEETTDDDDDEDDESEEDQDDGDSKKGGLDEEDGTDVLEDGSGARSEVSEGERAAILWRNKAIS